MRRVLVTGIGLVTPVGVGKDVTWNALLAGETGIGPVTSFDTSSLSVHLGAEIRRFDPGIHVRHGAPGQLGRTAQLAVAAARMAIEDAGLTRAIVDPTRAGAAIGTSYGEQAALERYNDSRRHGVPDHAAVLIPGTYPCEKIASAVADEFALAGPCLTIPAACAAGNYAIAYAFDAIRTGRTDVMLAGGADAFSRATYIGFARLGVIAPERCQPFDRNRRGMIPGEGAGVLVLESGESARLRRASVYAEVRGCGIACDAQHMTATDPLGRGALRAMSGALRESGADAGDLGYISAHGTGTPVNDRAECAALLRLLGARAPAVPMSSIKSMMGHCMGAASAIEAAVCALALATGIVPPTVNYEEPDPDCPVDCVPNCSRRVDPRVVLNNAFAFGGNTTSVCMGRWES